MSQPEGPVPQRQRVAAYAVVRREDGAVLLTRVAPRIAGAAGRWTLPGGGIDHGEDLRTAAVREVYEETGLHVEVGAVVDVRSAHWVGPRPDGVVEDFHAIQVVFAGVLRPESRDVVPHVTEDDSTTDRSEWVAWADVADLPTVPLVDHVVGLLAP